MATDKPHDLPASSEDGTLIAACHCNRVKAQLPSKPEKLNECHCTVCYKYGALWAYFARNEVKVTVAADTQLQDYTRDDSTVDISFTRCGHCGCMLFWRGFGKYAGPENKMGVNCRMLPESEIEGIEKKVSSGP
jgi:hypothetical protein